MLSSGLQVVNAQLTHLPKTHYFISEHGWNVVPVEKANRGVRSELAPSSTGAKTVPAVEHQEAAVAASPTTIGSTDGTSSGLRAGGLRSSTNSSTLGEILLLTSLSPAQIILLSIRFCFYMRQAT